MNLETCIIVVQSKIPSQNRYLEFLDILLDETLIIGTVYIPRQCLKKVSVPNKRLPAKQSYEFLLRLACAYPIYITDTAPSDLDSYMVLSSKEESLSKDGLKTDCYITALYKKILLEHHLFDSAVHSILNAAKQSNCYEQKIVF